MILAALLLGVGMGAGLWALVLYARPPLPPLSHLRAVLEPPSAPEPVLPVQDQRGWAARWGRPAAKGLRALGLPTPRTIRDLQVIGRPIDVLLAEKATLCVVGLLLPTAVQAVLLVAGLALPWQLPLAAGALCAVGGFWWPDADVRHQAARKRAAFRHALAAYLDLVRVSLAGGAGVDAALNHSVAIGQGWAFGHIRRALNIAQLTRGTPWTTLRQLGEELGVPELVELAASVSLAGTEGAPVRASLAAKASAMRARDLAESLGKAQAATERMSLPVICLMTGFLLFIGYPAAAHVFQSL
ncbi:MULTISPECIES: secretion system protein [Amycolatopsis]|uniref:Type II secretion system protein GspF domain-containing protein n=1 Tax=Amycolatopsis dongchuanensis TaxID=1070866 RepID=A0ABP9QX88_9PSEU